ncbi:hypothetical protein [Thermoanaerobacter mathranii]|uniref:hypothetical protein n=1 Tax=Thermoanaerobacter mathranii TaxID=583357 RepID=UPI003D6C0532
MLYLINLIDYDYPESQTKFLVKTDLSREKISKITEKIIDESKKKWNKEDDADSLSEIVEEALENTFGKKNIIEYEYLEFYW